MADASFGNVPKMVECQRCLSMNQEGSALCVNCGAPLPQSDVAPDDATTPHPAVSLVSAPVDLVSDSNYFTSISYDMPSQPVLSGGWSSPVGHQPAGSTAAASSWSHIEPKLIYDFTLNMRIGEVWWPCFCPCCLQALALPSGASDMGNGIWATRLRLDSAPPMYCAGCDRHHTAFVNWQAATAQRPQQVAQPNVARACGQIFAIGCLGLGCAWPLLATVLVVISNSLLSSDRALSLSFFLLMGLALVVALGKWRSRRKNEIEIARRWQEVLSQTKPDCCDPSLSAVVLDRHEAAPHLQFRNKEFARLFRELNELVITGEYHQPV